MKSIPASARADWSGSVCSVKFRDVDQDARPDPPREATLIRLARQAARIKAPAAARKAGISTARWSQIENGYERRHGQYKPISASPPTLAHMAHAVGLTPDRLAEAGREDAAEILTEILAQKPPPPDPPPTPPDDHLAPAKFIRDWLETYERLQVENPAAAAKMIGDARENIRRIREANEQRARNSA